ncbi:hypothetical protein [Nocardioides mangrovi]|uniref:Uncharacterized protein n=1 Tax=Nocardioides mangrovi TaxID=2874580 RepID=A0ABS7UH64_9ACTN|nr:hypothetical protein [Nocardioides mangrovi]MBZ5740174.1 hypothetical protein [Nocardioides mangrovi]
MAYSVVGGPALGFDLARLPGGRQVAGVVRVALAAGPEELEQLAECHPGPGLREEWRRACAPLTETPAMTTALPLAGAALEEAAAGETALLRRLETSLLGDVHLLDRLLRRDVLDWTWLHGDTLAVQDPIASLAADVLADAAASAYLRDRLPGDLRRAMAAPYLRAGLPLRDLDGATVGIPEVDQRLQVFASADHDVREQWRRAVDELRIHTAAWAPAMHQATWALSMSERLRLACDAQLAAVIAFDRGGFTARDAAYGVWNAWAGVVQASTVGDLLGSGDADVLLRPWNAVHGAPDQTGC